MLRLSRIGTLFPVMVVLSSIMGCVTFHSPFARKTMPKATAADPVVEIVCLWQPGEGSDPDGVPCRGFMGQVLFLSRSSSTPVQIEGDVRIYLFDDQGTEEEQAKPLRVFNFDNGSWAIHLTDSSFGPTYQVFVPYVRRGTPNANCSLRLRLKPKHGPVVFSEFTNMPLNGHKKTLRGDEAKPINQEEVDRLAAEAMSNDLRRTTTISLGPNPKTPESNTTAKKESPAGHIQLAAYEAGNDSEQPNPESERVRRLEAMVQQLLEQKNQAAEKLVQTPPIRRSLNNDRTDSEYDDDAGSHERFQMNPRGKIRRVGVERIPQTPPRQLRHPLEDDPSDIEPGQTSCDSEMNNSGHDSLDEPPDNSIKASPRFNLQERRN